MGGVLIDWNAKYLYRKIFKEESEMNHFLENICTPDWNEEQDGGRTLKEATETLIKEHPEHKEHISAFYDRWEEMLAGPIEGTVEIFRKMKGSKRYRQYALTNWSAELFPIALSKYDFLTWFDGIVVSGIEKQRKPSPDFYQLLLDRYQVKPVEALFIDDNLRNVKAAAAMGIDSIRFTTPDDLDKELKKRGIEV